MNVKQGPASDGSRVTASVCPSCNRPLVLLRLHVGVCSAEKPCACPASGSMVCPSCMQAAGLPKHEDMRWFIVPRKRKAPSFVPPPPAYREEQRRRGTMRGQAGKALLKAEL